MNAKNISELDQLCHICNTLQQVLLNDFKRCGKKQCRKIYCSRCIEINFREQNLDEDNVVDLIKDWICFSCQRICNCKLCSMYNNQQHQQMTLSKQEQLKSNNSQNPSYTINNQSIYQYRQQSHSPYQCSSQLPYHEKKSRGMICKSKKEKSFGGCKHQTNKKIPPYILSIIKRKQIFRKFMLEHSKKTYQQLLKESSKREEEKIYDQRKQNEKKQRYEYLQISHQSPVAKIQTFNTGSFNSSIDHLFSSPSQIPQTPSFLPISEPPSTNGLRLSQMLNEKLKQYQVEEDSLSLELI